VRAINSYIFQEVIKYDLAAAMLPYLSVARIAAAAFAEIASQEYGLY